MLVAVLSADAVRPVRQAVLRPNQTADELVFAGDDHQLALHVGSIVDGRVVAVASIAPESHPLTASAGDWRLRGMATLPQARGSGSGSRLLLVCLEHARGHGGRRVWCNARTGARYFYARLGFVAEGAEFASPGIGPHIRMAAVL